MSPVRVGTRSRTIILVGATSGMGWHAASRLSEQGHRLILVGRNARRGENLLARMAGHPSAGRRSAFIAGDVSTRAGIEAIADKVYSHTDVVDTLVNNAGVMMPNRRLTEEGIEYNLAVHHLAPYSMTGRLLPLLELGDGRVVNTNSEGHRATPFTGRSVDIDFSDLQSERRYDTFTAYSRTKLANLLFTFEFCRRYPEFTSVAVHPGMVRTRLARSLRNPAIVVANSMARWLMLPAGQGAKPIAYLAANPDIESGRYYNRFNPSTSSSQSMSLSNARLLWEATEQLRGPFVPSGAPEPRSIDR